MLSGDKTDEAPQSGIAYVGWEITNACDLDCEFCYSFMFKKMKVLSANELMIGIANLSQLGVRGLNFCGGEPLMHGDLPNLILFAKETGLETMLSTNGNKLRECLPQFATALDWIVLPLDGPTDDIHGYYRGSGNFSRVLELISWIGTDFPHINIKINTVVTDRNIEQLDGIAKLLQNCNVKWKLIQFSPRGRAEVRRETLEVGDDRFLKACGEVTVGHPKMDVDVSPNSARNCGCVVIDQRGDILSPCDTGYTLLGNVLDIGDCMQRIREAIRKADFVPAKNISILKEAYRWRNS